MSSTFVPTTRPDTGGGPDTGPVGFADRVTACTLDEFESQAVFTVLLETLARPGTIEMLPRLATGRMPAVMAPLAALADVDVTIAVAGPEPRNDHDWEAALAAATGARRSAIPDAAMVVCLGPIAVDTVAALCRGDAWRPEDGARVVLNCETLHTEFGVDETGTTEPGDTSIVGSRTRDPHDVVLELRGPGVDGARRIAVGGLESEVIETLRIHNSMFPAGVDTWLVTPQGHITGLPRSTSVRIIEAPSGTSEEGH